VGGTALKVDPALEVGSRDGWKIGMGSLGLEVESTGVPLGA